MPGGHHLSFTTMAASQSWQVTPSVATIQAVMKEVGATKTVMAIYWDVGRIPPSPPSISAKSLRKNAQQP